MQVTVATCNLNFGRSVDAHQMDVTDLKRRAHVVCTQEDVRDESRGRERVGQRAGMQIVASGRPLASLSTRGMRIRLRRFPWKDYDLPGLGTIRVVSVHMPPLRMRRVLYPIYAARLRHVLRSSPHPWLAGGDWNHLVTKDPADLAKHFGGDWYGRRIDGWAVHPDLVRYVERVDFIDYPHRKDNHPAVLLTLQHLIDVRRRTTSA